MKIERSYVHKNWFWIPFAITMSILILIGAMILVDLRCRRMGLGDYIPLFTVSTVIGDKTFLHYDILGVEGDLDITIVNNVVEYVKNILHSVNISSSIHK